MEDTTAENMGSTARAITPPLESAHARSNAFSAVESDIMLAPETAPHGAISRLPPWRYHTPTGPRRLLSHAPHRRTGDPRIHAYARYLLNGSVMMLAMRRTPIPLPLRVLFSLPLPPSSPSLLPFPTPTYVPVGT